ncbi:MAG TPA: DUF3014 domain-containing protein [Gammaproteobacteria bacterium]|nr:DUF3014 domain-containing protein [Gammaproteobacteria bacterium]
MEQQNREILGLVVVIFVISAIVVTIYLYLNRDETTGVDRGEPVPAESMDQTPAEDEKIIRNPLPAIPDEEEVATETEETETTEQGTGSVVEDLPEPAGEPAEPPQDPEQRRKSLNEALAELLADQFEKLFIPQGLVRHFVVTIDNMTREKLPQKFKFTQSPPGKFRVQGKDTGDMYMDPANYDRYNAFVALADRVDSEKLVGIYVRYYPLFQGTYEDIGYPNRYFNDRLVEVIDHLLETPRVEGKIALERPKVFYTFADPRLEALSAGQKILIRIGPQNAEKVRARLRELRRLLTSGN